MTDEESDCTEIIARLREVESMCEHHPWYAAAGIDQCMTRRVRLLMGEIYKTTHHWEEAEEMYSSCISGSRFDAMAALENLNVMFSNYPQVRGHRAKAKKYRQRLIAEYQKYIDYMVTCPGKDNPSVQASIREYREKIFQQTH